MLLSGRCNDRMTAAVAIAFACLALCPLASAATPPRALAPWHFSEDFSRGIPAWMSFPLAQDIGYDPSIYTATVGGRRVLIRDVIANGQTSLRIGMVKPLRFRIGPATVIRLQYAIKMDGNPGPAELTVGTRSGRKYSAALPASDGAHEIEVRGSSLGIAASGDDAALLVIEADTRGPVMGSHNQLILERLSIDAERRAQLPLTSPHLLASQDMQTQVASAIVDPGHPTLPIAATPGAGTVELTLFDGEGRQTREGEFTGSAIRPGPNPAPGLWRAHLAAGAAESDFRFLVLGRVPPHPRLWLTPQRLDQLRSGEAGDALRRIIQQKAASTAAAIAYNPKAGDNIALMSPVSVFPGLRAYAALLTTYGDAIMFNALDYRLRGSQQSLDAARRALLAVAAWSTWTPPWFSAHGLHTYYQVGVFMQQCAFGYDLIADQMSASEKAQVADGFYRNAIAPAVEEYFVNDRMPLAASNHMAHAVGGAIAACVALYDDVPDWNTRFGPALAELMVSNDDLLKGLFPGDGSEAEPAGYEDFAMEGMSAGMAALQRIGIKPPGTERMMESFWWPYYVQFKPGLLLDTGDWDGELNSLYGYAWTAEYAGEPALRAFYDTSVNQSVKSILDAARIGKPVSYPPTMFDLICCSQPAKPVSPLPPSRLFPLRGSAALRSGWGPDDTLVSIRVGAWFNHEHHDEGSFQVAAFGEELVGEAGYSDYYTDPRYQNYFTQVPGHNTVMLDDDAFSQNSYQGRYWPGFRDYPQITRHVLGAGVDYLSADLTAAYAGALKSYTREFVFLKPDVLLIRDRLHGAAPHRYAFLLHVPTGASAVTERNTATIRSEHASAFALAEQNSAHWTESSAPVPITAYGNLDRIPVEPRYKLKIETGKQLETTFTVGLQFLPSSSAAPALKTISTSNASGFSADSDSDPVAALFRTGSGDLAYRGVTTDGDLLARVERDHRLYWFAGNAHSVREKNRELYSAKEPADVELVSGAAGETATVFLAHASAVSFEPGRPARQISVDGKQISAGTEGNSIRIQLQEGEHSVRIAY